jgi:hypothetical protein
MIQRAGTVYFCQYRTGDYPLESGAELHHRRWRVFINHLLRWRFDVDFAETIVKQRASVKLLNTGASDLYTSRGVVLASCSVRGGCDSDSPVIMRTSHPFA